MEIIETIAQMRELAQKTRAQNKKIGFVPTMGFLHEGHASLMDIAASKCDFLVVSIFVNPTQFAPNEDFARYPKDFERDSTLCAKHKVDALFVPVASEMYPSGFCTYLSPDGAITERLCGTYRPNHFRGVATVVVKLFNIVTPHCAVFGAKDAQQLAVIRRVVRDLDLPIELIAAPIVREHDGLAMSSRNTYLSAHERAVAPQIFASLLAGKLLFDAGERDCDAILSHIRQKLAATDDFVIQYLEAVDPDTMLPRNECHAPTLIAIAVFLGKTRLIDNILL